MMQEKSVKRYLIIILPISIPLGYTLWNMRQAKGMGRYQCVITHDGRTITGWKTGFLH